MMKRTDRWICLGLLVLTTTGSIRADEPATMAPVPWPATDGLNRSLPIAGEVPTPRPGRFVGMFYFLWHEPRGGPRSLFDVSQILAAAPDALHQPTSPPWGPMGFPHYWSEPLFGYYRGDDRWVIRRHAQLLTDAGVDVLIFDATNAETYPHVYSALGEVFTAIRASGGRTPQMAFMVNTEARKTARQLYHDLYQPGRFRDLWFLWQGKPLLICDPAEADPEITAFFTLRRAHWPTIMENTRRAWHWEATYPQPFGYDTDPTQPEQVDVAVAQNLQIRDGKPTTMTSGNARGRSFHDGARDTSPGALDRGGNFAEQWRRAIELDPPFILVTGWNEWIAGRFERPGEPVAFVDQFDREYSRDIEPMKGGHGDAYYYQLVANVRRYKGVAAIPKASKPKSILLGAGSEAWQDVTPVFTDSAGDTLPRGHPGIGGNHYVNRSGRHDLIRFQVARDATHLSFLAESTAPISEPTGLWLLIDGDQNPATGWEGFDHLIRVTSPTTASLARNIGGWNWGQPVAVSARIDENRLHLMLPRAALGLTQDGPVRIDFKWADNLPEPGSILDFYSMGDVAPEGRFKFRYDAD